MLISVGIPSALLLALSLMLLVLSSKCLNNNKFLHITDLHVDPDYALDGDPKMLCHSVNGSNESGRWHRPKLGPYGDHDCDAPEALINYMLGEAKKVLPDPDFIVWTGDSLPHDAYDDETMVDMIQNLTSSIEKYFPGAFLIPVVGNHDSAPANQFEDHPARQRIYEQLYGVWKKWVGRSGKDTFVRGGYYRLEAPFKSGSVFLVLNTNVYYLSNGARSAFIEPDDPTGQFDFLQFELEKAQQNNYSVHILGHVPPGAFEKYFWNKTSMEQMPAKYNKRLLSLILEYAPSIEWMLFGHYHTDTFRIVKDSYGKPVARLFAAPAITPAFQLNNPAFRVVEYNPSNLALEDIKTFYVDLDELNKNGAEKTRARLAYSMRDTYGGLDAVSLGNYVRKVEANDTLFEQLIRHNRAMYYKPEEQQLNATERAYHLCALQNIDYDQLERCLAASVPDPTDMPSGAGGFSIMFTSAPIMVFIALTICDIFCLLLQL